MQILAISLKVSSCFKSEITRDIEDVLSSRILVRRLRRVGSQKLTDVSDVLTASITTRRRDNLKCHKRDIV
jgi:hypothetical protein